MLYCLKTNACNKGGASDPGLTHPPHRMRHYRSCLGCFPSRSRCSRRPSNRSTFFFLLELLRHRCSDFHDSSFTCMNNRNSNRRLLHRLRTSDYDNSASFHKLIMLPFKLDDEQMMGKINLHHYPRLSSRYVDEKSKRPLTRACKNEGQVQSG